MRKLISRYLDTNGDGTGTKEVLNANATPVEFYIQPPAGETYILTRMIVSMSDSGTMDSGGYGNNGASPLTNGITVVVERKGSLFYSLTDPDYPVKTNGEWGALCYDVDPRDYGQGDEYINVRWTFAKSGEDVRLNGNKNDRLVVTASDTLSHLVTHKFLVQGRGSRYYLG